MRPARRSIRGDWNLKAHHDRTERFSPLDFYSRDDCRCVTRSLQERVRRVVEHQDDYPASGRMGENLDILSFLLQSADAPRSWLRMRIASSTL